MTAVSRPLSLKMLSLWLVLSAAGVADVAAIEYRGLEGALTAVMEHNPAVKGQQAQIYAQQAGLSSAKAGRYPSLTAQAGSTEDGQNSGSLRLRQPLWAFGRIDRTIDSAEALVEQERVALLQVQRQLIEDTVVAYSRVISLHARLEVAQSDIDQHQKLFQRIQQRQRGQLASQADVHLAHSRLIRSRSQLQRFQGELDAALAELYALTLVRVHVSEPIDTRYTDMASEVVLQQQAQAQHADIGRKREQVEVARRDLERERVADAPTLFIQLEHAILDLDPNTDRTQAGFVIEANVDGLGLAARGRTHSAAARLKAAQYDLDLTRNEVRRRIDILLLNRSLQHRLRQSQQQAIDAVAATMASFVRQYDSGRKSWVDVLNTQRELTEQRQQMVQIEADWQASSLRIASLIGVLDPIAGIDRQ